MNCVVSLLFWNNISGSIWSPAKCLLFFDQSKITIFFFAMVVEEKNANVMAFCTNVAFLQIDHISSARSFNRVRK